MALFNKQVASQPVSHHNELELKYNRARINILTVILFTLINVIILVTNGNTYFLFSAYIPYLIADFGMALGGMYPSEFYVGANAGVGALGTPFFVFTMVIIAAILLIYLFCWIFSKKGRVGWMITALVLFGIDTALMLILNRITSEMIVDIVFHAWVVISLIIGISSHYKLKKLPPEEIEETLELDEISQSAVEE